MRTGRNKSCIIHKIIDEKLISLTYSLWTFTTYFFYTSDLTRTLGYLSCCSLTLWRIIYNNGDRIWPHLKYGIKALISCFTARASLVSLVARIITNHPSFYTYYFRQENQIDRYFLINLYILHVHLTPFLNMFFYETLDSLLMYTSLLCARYLVMLYHCRSA